MRNISYLCSVILGRNPEFTLDACRGISCFSLGKIGTRFFHERTTTVLTPYGEREYGGYTHERPCRPLASECKPLSRFIIYVDEIL